MDVAYTAVGKGLYELSVPPGGILDQFDIALAANGSDVRLLELSLQPTSLTRSSGATNYLWEYKRLLFGQPLRLDVLGIAPIDRLGELTWLGPISVAAFGLLVGLVIRAYGITAFDRWMLLLTIGTFAGAYPLMYFAQEYVSLFPAVLISAAVAIVIIGVRAVTLMGFWRAVAGVVAPAAAQEPLKIGFVYVSPVGSAGWTYQHDLARQHIAGIKAVVPQMALDVVDRAIQTYGGAGVSQATPLAEMWAGLRTLRIADGPDEVHLRDVARLELKAHLDG